MSSPVPGQVLESREVGTLDASAGRRSLTAFLLSGIVLSFLGAILPSWHYHLKSDFTQVGDHFLSLYVGFLLAAAVTHFLLPRTSIKWKLLLASVLASSGFIYLGFFSPPASAGWRMLGVLWIGVSAGLLNAGIFQAISPLYRRDRAATMNLAGILLGLGCLLTSLIAAASYSTLSARGVLLLFAIPPALFAAICAGAKLKDEGAAPPSLPLSQVLRDFHNPGAILFSLLLFFQFANEWSIAGWLPLFLVGRLGISPGTALLLLALYWGALLVGRILSQVALKRVNAALLLTAAIVSSLLGAMLLASTNNEFGAVMGILFVGAGFAPIYPLVVVRIRNRFPYYHPGFYNGIFSVAVTGGFLAPWLLGFVARSWGIQAVMLVPALGVFMVFVLALLILLDAKLRSLAEAKSAGF